MAVQAVALLGTLVLVIWWGTTTRDLHPTRVAVTTGWVRDGAESALPVVQGWSHPSARVGMTEDSSRTLEVLVVDEDDRRIDGAVLALEALGDVAIAGPSEHVGAGRYQLRVCGASDVDALLTVRAGGYATHVHRILDIPTDAMVVRLSPAGRISGQVVLADGTPPPVSVVVCAFTEHWDHRWLHLVSTGRPSLPCVFTDERGQFVIDDLDPRTDYAVGCGGRGWVCSQVLHPVRPNGGSHVCLTLWRGYGCLIRPTATGGLPPSDFARVTTWARPESGADVLATASWEATLIQVGCRWMESGRQGDDWRNRLLLVKSPWIRPALGGTPVEYEVPGYQACVADVPLPALEVDALTEATFPMVARSGGMAAIRASFETGYSLSRRPGRALRSALALVLSSVDDPNLRLERAIPSPSLQDVEIAGVPYGTYRVSLAAAADAWTATPTGGDGIVLVGAEPQVLRFDLKRLGCLDLRVPDSRGERTHPTSVTLTSDTGASVTVQFLSPPFLVEGLVPGTYKMRVRRGDSQGGRDGVAEESIVFIGPGAVTQGEAMLAW